MEKVLVTGVSGYIGNHCATELLKNGYAVKGTLRSLSRANEVINIIKKEIGSEENLEFCDLDLLDDKGWDEAMNDCKYVLHVASPYLIKEPKDENLLIKPALDGTKRVLEAAKRAGVKRVVLTSSIVAMLENADKSININSKSWTNVNARNVSAYAKSKTLAEKFAWDFIHNQNGDSSLELVVINPGPVFGPTLSGDLTGTSMNMFNKMISGKMPLVPQASLNISDVRDVAKIHVLALKNEKANGKRFIVTTESPHSFQEVAQILKASGYKKVSTRLAPNSLLKFIGNFDREARGMRIIIGKKYSADISSTLDTFDWKPIDLKTIILDTAKSINGPV